MIIVRSQDKETIGRYTEIKADECVIKGIGNFGTMTVLGTYPSRERALEVLERIHNCLLEGTVKDYLDRKYRVKQDTVFIMPPK